MSSQKPFAGFVLLRNVDPQLHAQIVTFAAEQSQKRGRRVTVQEVFIRGAASFINYPQKF